MKLSMWLVVGGLAVDLIDAFTTKAGTTGGILYGPNGYAKSINAMVPLGLKTGEAIAMIGAAMLMMEKRG